MIIKTRTSLAEKVRAAVKEIEHRRAGVQSQQERIIQSFQIG
jgi:hypothetical protein